MYKSFNFEEFFWFLFLSFFNFILSPNTLISEHTHLQLMAHICALVAVNMARLAEAAS